MHHRGHVSPVGLGVVEAPAVVAGEALVEPPDLPPVEAHGRVGVRQLGVRRTLPDQEGFLDGSGDAAEDDLSGAVPAHPAHPGGDVVDPVVRRQRHGPRGGERRQALLILRRVAAEEVDRAGGA